MQSKKVTMYSMPDFVGKIVELTKAGKEIDLNWTRASYGLSYTVAYFDEATESVTESVAPIEAEVAPIEAEVAPIEAEVAPIEAEVATDVAEVATDVASEATEPVADSSEPTPQAKPKGRQKASA
jgi:hypothetical protein